MKALIIIVALILIGWGAYYMWFRDDVEEVTRETPQGETVEVEVDLSEFESKG